MRTPISALAVNEDVMLWGRLGAMLQEQNVQTRYVRSCREARRILECEAAPEIVFTGVKLCDGTWRDVLEMAKCADPSPAVILVTRLDEIQLYLDAMNDGACDYIVPPFAAADVAHVIASAVGQHAPARPAAPPAQTAPPFHALTATIARPLAWKPGN